MCSFLSVDNFVSGGDLLLIFKSEIGSNKSNFSVISKYSHNLEKDIKINYSFFKKAFSF